MSSFSLDIPESAVQQSQGGQSDQFLEATERQTRDQFGSAISRHHSCLHGGVGSLPRRPADDDVILPELHPVVRVDRVRGHLQHVDQQLHLLDLQQGDESL